MDDVLIDSCVWSTAIRKRSPDLKLRHILDHLMIHERVRIIGPVRQECLSGISDPNRYAHLRAFFRNFIDFPLISEDHEIAASFFNRCRSKGIQGSHTDFLICAVAYRKRFSIFTIDDDFDRFAPLVPIIRFVP